MRLNPSQFTSHLEKPLAPIYVIGGDPLLVQEAADRLRTAARGQGFEERQVLEVERGFDWSQLAQASASLSLFATRRLIELRLPGSAPGDAGGKALRELAASPVDDTVVMVVCGELEWRTLKSAWFSAIEKAGHALFLEAPPPARLPGWIASRLKAAGLSASEDAVELLAERTEGNLLAAQQDIEKLRLLHPGGRLDREQVRAAVSDSARYEAFDLIDKVLEGDSQGVARGLQRLREEGLTVPEIIGPWSWALRVWCDAAGHYARTGDARAACAAARIFGPRQVPYLKALPRAPVRQVLGWLEQCSVIDLKGKSTGGQPSAWEDLLTCMLAASGTRTAAS